MSMKASNINKCVQDSMLVKKLQPKMMFFDWSVTIIVSYGYILIGLSSYIVVAYLDNFDTCLSNDY